MKEHEQKTPPIKDRSERAAPGAPMKNARPTGHAFLPFHTILSSNYSSALFSATLAALAATSFSWTSEGACS